MNVGAVVQARMSSRRFPGKVLYPVHGRPLIEYVLEHLRSSREIERPIVATSVDPSDDPIADYCRCRDVDCFRGSLHDVASRFREVSELYALDVFVRVCGDSPLLDPSLIDRGVREFLSVKADLVTNCCPRTFPAGQSVEVVRASTFRSACARMTSSGDLEHVTAFLYRHPRHYRIHNFANPAGDQSHINLSVNTPGEMARFAQLVDLMGEACDLPRMLECYRATAVMTSA